MSQVDEVKNELYSKLKDQTVPVDQKDRYIGYLYLLDTKDEDPISFFIINQYQYMIENMHELFTTVIDLEESPNKDKQLKDLLVRSGIKNKLDESIRAENLDLQDDEILFMEDHGRKRHNNFALFIFDTIGKICNILYDNLQILWRFCRYSLEDKYKQEIKNKESKSEVRKIKERERKLLKEAEFEGLFNEIYNMFSVLITELFYKMDDGTLNQPETIRALQLVSNRIASIAEFKMQVRFSKPLFEFVHDLKNEMVTKLMDRTINAIKQLYTMEDWEMIKESNSTKLPLIFRTYMYDMISTLNTILEDGDVSRTPWLFLTFNRE